MARPYLAETVHYVEDTPLGPECRAAVVTRVDSLPDPRLLTLCVLPPLGIYHVSRRNFTAPRDTLDGIVLTPGTWHWLHPEELD